jgi:hypothetical protein
MHHEPNPARPPPLCHENGRLRRRAVLRNGHLVAEAVEATDELRGDLGLVEVVEIGGTEVPVVDARREEVIGGDQDLVADGDGSTVVAPPGFEPKELVSKVAAVLSAGPAAASTRAVVR